MNIFILVATVAAVVFAKEDPFTPGDAIFPSQCSPDVMTRSASSPTSVNAVRPADIKVVAALGDSLTAANGALATDIVEVLNMYRGVSFPIGGDGNLSYTVTVPNILRKFNPKVYGQSYKWQPMGLPTDRSEAQFNVAVPGSTCPDLIPQAHQLVTLMKADKNVDFANDWKLVSLFFGGNDACAYCKASDEVRYSPESMKTNLRTILSILAQMPKTIVQLTGMLHLEILRKLKDNVGCQTLHVFECDCIEDPKFTNADLAAMAVAYQQKQMEVMTEGQYDRNDFTFVVQPLIEHDVSPPLSKDGTVDMDFFAPDCFHFHIKGHNTVSRYLWNNMMQAVGNKTKNSNLSDNAQALLCPDKNCPFIRTVQNSKNCATFMH